MAEDKLDSSESEGMFNDFIDQEIEKSIESILEDGNLDLTGPDIIVETDDIMPPRFTFDNGESGSGSGNQGPGNQRGKLLFRLPIDRFLKLIRQKLVLPDLAKESRGKIKEVSYEYKTFGPIGTLLDKKRTFKRAIKSSVGTGMYDPENEEYDIMIRKRDKRFKLPERVEKPKYKAVVFYGADISYSTHGKRLELEKKMVNFIKIWLEYNYGPNNVEHRFFVHDCKAYEISEDQFFNVSNAGGTEILPIFQLVDKVARDEYDIKGTNMYFFYFTDGEIFGADGDNTREFIQREMVQYFNRIGIVEILPSSYSKFFTMLSKYFSSDKSKVKLSKMEQDVKFIKNIKDLFG